jgi:signal transduction histidine kinase
MPPLRQITIPVMLRGMFTGQVIQVGASMEKNERLLESVLLVLWTVLPIGAFIASLIVYFMATSALTPVSVMTKAASSLEVQNLSGRIPVPRAKDQLRELAITFNHLMDRVQESVLKLRRFTGDVSHELRTPLAVIKGEAEFALRKPRTAEEYQKTLEIIRRESGGMAKIIEELLLLARVEGHAVKMNWGQVSIPAFIRQLQDDSRTLALEKQVTVTIQVKTPSGDFEASEGYLLLAVRNILFNAVKHSPPGGEVIMCFEKLYSKETQSTNFKITISDKGGGIPEEDLPFIFDPFYRVDSSRNRSIGGTGIGLSLAMALIKMHEGKVEVESRLGMGSDFKIIIPQSNASQKKQEVSEPLSLKEGLQT